MKLKYNGTDERVFPSVGITLNPGDEFDAPEGFNHPDCTPAGAKAFTASAPKEEPTTTKMSAAPDLKAGE